jgi:hypothetical protein
MSFDVYWQPWFVCKQTGETYYKWPISEQVTLAARRFSSLSDGTEDFEYFLLEDNKPFRACDIEVLDLIDRLMQL